MNKLIKTIFGGWVSLISFIIALITLFTVFVNDSNSLIVALSFFCFLLFILFLYLIIILYKISSCRGTTGSDGFDSKSSFIKYEQCDDNRIIYESYKTIQSTVPLLTEVDWSFNWTGTEIPKISSNLQTVTNVLDLNDPSKYDKAILKLNKAVFYNQSTVLHFFAECDDTDKKSSPFIASRVVNNTDIVIFRVILRNKSNRFNKNAILERTKNGILDNKEKIREIPFDKGTKTYEYSIISPDVGYTYSLTWDK